MNTYSSYTTADIKQIFTQLHTVETGLSHEEAHVRHGEYGPNEIQGKEVSWWNILSRQFKSSFIYLLLGAVILSFSLGELVDGIMILAFVLINTGLGFFQEYRSEHALRVLKTYMSEQVRVRRGNEEKIINKSELVPGDVVIIEAGDIIPADIRFFKEQSLTVDESILTGESVSVKKVATALDHPTHELYNALNIGFSGTTVVSGKGEGIVIAIGKETVMGNVARLTTETRKESVFEKNLQSFSTFILRLVVITLAFILVANIFIKGPNNSVKIIELVVFSIALAVSVIPEALPVVTSFSLSRGALRLAKQKVIVKRLSSIEDLGSIQVLCTDKTGTLTENRLTIAETFSPDQEKTILYASIAAPFLEERHKQPNNTFDLALWNHLSAAQKDDLDEYKKISEIPFDPQRRRNSVLVNTPHAQELIIRGASEHILPFCQNLNQEEQKAASHWILQQGQQGRRVIAIASKQIEKGSKYTVAEEENKVHYRGLISFVDPIKKTTFTAVEKAKKLGVKVKILTGDSPDVAGAVAHQIGLVGSLDEVITGEILQAMSRQKQHRAVEKYSVFARVSPEQKYQIIHMLQEKNEIGFLGEGINDAPALKAANVALVVQGASDIAKEVADIVLLKKSLAVIIDGIEEGRRTFVNTLKYIRVTLSSNFGNFYTVAIASLLVDFLPMLPLQILLVNLLSDFPMIAIATDSIDSYELKKPKRYNIREIALLATILGIVSSIFDFIIFGLFYRQGPEILQTNWFIASILTELIFLYSMRTKMLFFRARKPSGAIIILTIIASVATVIIPFTQFGQRVFHFIRPSTHHIVLILSIMIIYFIITESVKLFYYRSDNH